MAKYCGFQETFQAFVLLDIALKLRYCTIKLSNKLTIINQTKGYNCQLSKRRTF